jgi:hypothetical protein
VLQPPLGARIPLERPGVVRPGRHLVLEDAEPLLERDQVGAASQHVVAQGQVALARRPLVVQRRPGAFLEHELAAVDRALSGRHAEQRGLARAVAPSEGHAVAPLELERDAAEQGSPRHILVERAGDHDGHVPQSSHTAHRGHTARSVPSRRHRLARPG